MPKVPRHVGPYRIESLLGQGGSAEVYRATREGGRPVALKVLRRGQARRDRHRFVEEARLARDLESPHLVRVLEADLDGNRPWMAMELVPGADLATGLGRERSRVRELAPRILTGLLEALEVLHDVDLAHRDVTPANILLTDKGGVLLVDMGLTGRPGANRSGTLAYQPPEVLRGGIHRAASDVYQAGAVLYEVLSGMVPHEDLGGGYLDRRKAGDPPGELVEVVNGVSPTVSRLIAALLDPDPDTRPTASAAAKQARHIPAPWFHGPPVPDDFQESPGVPGRPNSVPGRSQKRRRHLPTPALQQPLVEHGRLGWIAGALVAGTLLVWLLDLI